MFRVIIPNSVKRDLNKLDKTALQTALLIMEGLSSNPFHGSTLTGIIDEVRKINFKVSNVQYRLVYKIYYAEYNVIVILVGTRENFYQELKRRL